MAKIFAKKRVPVILDTDIGGDIDDTWALAFLLNSPELDVKLIVTDTGNTAHRARIVAKMLEIGGRTDVPVGIGLGYGEDFGPQKAWVENYDLPFYPGNIHEDGVSAIIDTIMNSNEQITLITIGPVHNIGVALDREPRIAGRARFVGMLGSIKRGYDGSKKISAEYNVANFTKDCQKVFSAPWDITISPLDTCGIVKIKGENYRKVYNSRAPLAKAVIENYRIWAKNAREHARGHKILLEKESSILFDTVAIYLSFSYDFLEMERIGVRVTDEGFTVPDEKARKVNCAMKWKDIEAFENLLVERLTGI